MTLSIDYLATVFNSTIRLMTPILFVTLSAVICARVDLFNIGLEGTMLAGAFAGIVVNYYTHSVWMGVLSAGLAGCLCAFIVSFVIIKLKASPLVTGMAMNTLMTGTTTFLMTIIFGSKGVFIDPSLSSLPKINLPLIRDIPVVGKMFSNLTILDYGAFIIAILLYIFLFKTVSGYRLRAVGINREAARSLGTRTENFQIITVTASGFLCGLGGALLTLGSVVCFTQGISSGRGYIALVACSLGINHPLGAIAACSVFGFSEAIGNVLQSTSVKSQLTDAIPYIITIIALLAMNVARKRKKKKLLKGVKNEKGN